jgi:hypothetical protein
MRRLLWLCWFVCGTSFADENQCNYYHSYLNTAKKHGIKAYQAPSEIFYSGAKCALEKGDSAEYERSLSFASIFGDPAAISKYSHDLFVNSGSSNTSLILLASMMESKKEELSFNGRFWLGLYFSTAKKVINVDHLSRADLAVYGTELLAQASDYYFGFTASYLLAAVYKAKGNPNWTSFVAKGDESQIKQVGRIQITCSEIIKKYAADIELDFNLIAKDCD